MPKVLLELNTHEGFGDTADLDKYVAKMSGLGIEVGDFSPSDPSPLASCLSNQRFEPARKLRGLGARLDYHGADGAGALHQLAEFSSKYALGMMGEFLEDPKVKALVDRGGQGGQTALHVACGHLNAGAIELLLKAGASPNAKDAKGWTPIRHLLRKFGAKAVKKCEPILNPFA